MAPEGSNPILCTIMDENNPSLVEKFFSKMSGDSPPKAIRKGGLVTRLRNVKKTFIAFEGESTDIFGEEPFKKRRIIFVYDCAKNWITVFRRHLGTRTILFTKH
ncbi:hypothetical protein CEXT_140411 [Caerostris extrusa]|uniref:Uncharacterized protein n=1 Tax=Caerostris extrusa TaxID=172846 RepID=A0AAV4XHX1_CAEEX|nr:hypothetical protein CEXT_140411 [Caerostris extrusa]